MIPDNIIDQLERAVAGWGHRDPSDLDNTSDAGRHLVAAAISALRWNTTQ